jgi:hypothetical protein
LKRSDRQILLSVTSAVEHDGGVILVEQAVPARAWDAGLTIKERLSQMEVATREFARLSAALQGDPRWSFWRVSGRAEYRWLLERCIEHGGEWLTLVAATAPVSGMRERAANMFRTVIDTVYARAYPVLLHGVFTPAAPVCPFVEPRAHAWRVLARSVLTHASQPLDEWHQAATLGLLLNPDLAAIRVALGFWLGPPADGQTDLERQAGAMVGAPDTTERAAIKAKRDARREQGYKAPRRAPGTKPGSVRRAGQHRHMLEAYFLERSGLGLQPKQIAADANALALYRAWRGDRDARLSAAIVRRWLGRLRRSGSASA